MIIPRPAQELAIPAARKALQETDRALVVLATALGKMLASALIWHGFKKGPGIFLVHDNGILDHAMQEYRKVYGRRAKLVAFEGRTEDLEGADILFSTFQMMGNHLHHLDRKSFIWMTVDETHHAQAKTYRRVVEHFECPRLGITATPDRKDMLDIRELFGPEVINISLEEAIARGWLPPIEYHVVTDEGFDEEALKRITHEVMEEGQRLSLQDINRRIFIRARDEKIAEIIEQYQEQTLVFCRNIDHAEHFVPFLRSAETYHSGHSRDHNRRVLERLRVGNTKRVLVVNGANEGIDVPDVGLIAFNRSTESETIFKQQLGRGMRPGKEMLRVLDFVGNLERIRMLQKMVKKIKKLREEHDPEEPGDPGGPWRRRLNVSGEGFDFVFSDSVVDLMTVLERVETEFYATWQEAAEATRKLGIKTVPQYKKEYKRDPRLPSNPNDSYGDWVNWRAFLNKEAPNFYPTWQEAGRASISLGIRDRNEYEREYRADPRLPSNPHITYPDFPGIAIFLERSYLKWEDASASAQRLGIKRSQDYAQMRTLDPKLPGNPRYSYSDFPGWVKFLGKKNPVDRNFYETWREASAAVGRLRIKTVKEYPGKRKRDPRLHVRPDLFYTDFPGWSAFFGREKPKFYLTWQEATQVIRREGIKTQAQYTQRRNEDPKLPSTPSEVYSDFPGWVAYLGKTNRRS